MKRKVILAATLFMSMIAMAQTVSERQVVDPNAGLGIRKSITRRSEVPNFSLNGGIINVTFQAPSNDTSVYITDGSDLYFETGLAVNSSTTMPIPTYNLPKGEYYVIVENESNTYYQTFQVD